jgi:hypothetical protein
MATTPAVTSETRKRQAEARNGLAKEVDKVVVDFMNNLDGVARKHGRYVCFQMVSLWPHVLMHNIAAHDMCVHSRASGFTKRLQRVLRTLTMHSVPKNLQK